MDLVVRRLSLRVKACAKYANCSMQLSAQKMRGGHRRSRETATLPLRALQCESSESLSSVKGFRTEFRQDLHDEQDAAGNRVSRHPVILFIPSINSPLFQVVLVAAPPRYRFA
jgi:hypothetical protein